MRTRSGLEKITFDAVNASRYMKKKIPPERGRAHRSRRREGRHLRGPRRTCRFGVCARAVLARLSTARADKKQNVRSTSDAMNACMSKKDPARETSRASLAASRWGGIFAFRVERVASMCAHVRCSIESTARADKKQLHKQTIAFSFTFDAMNEHTLCRFRPAAPGRRVSRVAFFRGRGFAPVRRREPPRRAPPSRDDIRRGAPLIS